jgi:hypothetical protein
LKTELNNKIRRLREDGSPFFGQKQVAWDEKKERRKRRQERKENLDKKKSRESEGRGGLERRGR